jgi:2-polyprenyl-3-methyl-5-hydroxy-6-metoxy-1,4-benzoquinol methylase
MISHADLEYPSCPLCSSNERDVRYANFSGGYKVVRCCACGLHYLFPRLTETAMQQAYARADYFEGGACGYSDVSYTMQERALRATFKRLMRNLQKHDLTGGDLLEAGCGYGYLLEEARGFFRSRTGIEFSHEGVILASSKADRVYEGGLEQLPAEKQFDCIIATQVIEHVYEPLAFVRQLVRHSKPNGKVVLATPDIGGMLRKMMGRFWPSFKIPEHILYFDAATLSALMRKAGLTQLHSLPYPHAFPLALIAKKLRLPFPAALGNVNVWVPATTVAIYGTVAQE